MLFNPHMTKAKLCSFNLSIPIFAFSTLLVLYYIMASSNSHPGAPPPQGFHFKYTVQKGYFAQSEDSTSDGDFDFKKQNFGLIERDYDSDATSPSPTQWARFAHHVRGLNDAAGEGAAYKVLFLGRHGQGWHNVAEAKYGTKAWDCYYSALDGYDNMTWSDALLTPLGQQQALDAHAVWAAQLPHGLPAPETYYVSPLTRAIETADLTFRGLGLPTGRPYAPLVKELVREALGVHTCDRRSARSEIAAAFPHVAFEDGFEEEDGLWEKDYREPRSARRYRLARLLDDVFASDEGVVLSLTSHSGAIRSMLKILGHREFALETGGVIPVVVKAEKVSGEREVPKKEPSAAPPMCDGPPEM